MTVTVLLCHRSADCLGHFARHLPGAGCPKHGVRVASSSSTAMAMVS